MTIGPCGTVARARTQPSESRAALDAFLADNPELHRLTAKLSQFNLFEVLRATNHELRHSNVLGWLMDPSENHSLSDAFLRRFLSRCLLSNQARAEVDVPLSAAQIEMADLAQAEVRREWQHIDILVAVPAPYEWLFIIENKVHARESEGQLKRYREVAEQAFDGWTIVPIFLTLDGHDPSEEGQEQGYIPFGHQDVADLLADLVDLNGNLPSGVQLLLDHYLQTIRRLTMSDPEITRLCQEIYKRHRRAIELILEHGTVVEASGAASRVLSSQ